ncbi:hypothetical protein B5G10_03760 [Barnesiella sp. An55]|nr:hypothetical protein B5G10_03760 [Barnesiella sp. An55]
MLLLNLSNLANQPRPARVIHPARAAPSAINQSHKDNAIGGRNKAFAFLLCNQEPSLPLLETETTASTGRPRSQAKTSTNPFLKNRHLQDSGKSERFWH